jgi:hypothetical protein
VARTAQLSFPDPTYPFDPAFAVRQTQANEIIPIQEGADGIDLWGWHIPWTDHGVPGIRTWLNKDMSSNHLWEAMKTTAGKYLGRW